MVLILVLPKVKILACHKVGDHQNSFDKSKEQGKSMHVSKLVYLSTRPQGCNYAEFWSGECWGGNAIEYDNFHSIIQAWDDYQVVFSPIDAFEDERGTRDSPTIRSF
jgi:hypothetical protein